MSSPRPSRAAGRSGSNAKRSAQPKSSARGKVTPKQERSPVNYQQLLDMVTSAVMVVDNDFIVKYVNKGTMDLFARHADSFRRLFPTFNPATIVGTCIDIFHRAPAHQRQLLADPKNLPYTTDIAVGAARIQLHVNELRNEKGERVGFTLEWGDVTSLRNSAGQLLAINKAQCVVEFSTSGEVLTANENFLKLTGYSLEEIVGKHHASFLDPAFTASVEFRQFWTELAQGKYFSGEYRYFGRDGKEIWISATYNPILDLNGRTFKIVQYATDITEAKRRTSDYEGQLNAISKSQAVVEFNMDGTILHANENFCKIVGYSAEELRGKHHSIFVDAEFQKTAEYRQFWSELNNARFSNGEYKRLTKDGRAVWMRASYNPIVNLDGRPYKVVKYATDVTDAKNAELQVIESRKAEAEASASLKNSVTEILNVTNRVAAGDYSTRLRIVGQDAISELADGLQKFFDHKQSAEAAERERVQKELAEIESQRRKVEGLLDVVGQLAEGDFSVEFPDFGDDAVGRVSAAIAESVSKIREALIEVREVSNTVASAAAQMSSASTEISKGAQHQASSLEETASSLEEITSTAKQNTDNAQQARQLANGSRDIADKGGTVVGEAVKAMSEINRASTRIADIITTIDEIAFQTNLLALNAAVEAARAGEQGRGFAVVAAEVRNLAQRSAASAKEIKSLIQDSVRKVENGTELVNQSGKTLDEIVGSVKRVTDIVSEIAAASKEQLSGIEQVNKAVSQMDRVTQSNASQTEEMSGTATALLDHAQQLREAVSRFRLDADESTSAKSKKQGRKTRPERTRTVSAAKPSKTNSQRSVEDAPGFEELVTTGYQEF